MSESQEAPVVFSNKARRGNIRKKKKGEGDDEEDETGDVRALLEETKREQKFRARGGGVDTGTLLTGGSKKNSEVVLDDAVEQSLLESQFSAENEGGTGNLSVMEQKMMEYIDQKMSKDKPGEEETRVLTADDELYVIPESMRIKEKQQIAIENTAESYLTGIVEVELSMEDKLKNIEETEMAKKKMLENMRKGVSTSSFRVDTKSDKGYQRMDQKEKKKGGRSAQAPRVLTDDDKNLLALPVNTNSNFHLSNPVVANKVAKKPAAVQEAGAPGGDSAAPKRNMMSSDDMVMEKFKKRFRR